jgi:precorrin-6B methylase 1
MATILSSNIPEMMRKIADAISIVNDSKIVIASNRNISEQNAYIDVEKIKSKYPKKVYFSLV